VDYAAAGELLDEDDEELVVPDELLDELLLDEELSDLLVDELSDLPSDLLSVLPPVDAGAFELEEPLRLSVR
jgi:hypothetical protein